MADVVIVPGKDIVDEAGGHSSYSRALGRAASAAGYTPHIFCIGSENATIERPYGVVHSTPSPLRWLVHHGPGEGLRTRFLPFHLRPIRKRLKAFLRGRSGPIIVHGMGPWGTIGLDLARDTKGSNLAVIPIATVFTTMEDEHSAKRRGVSRSHGFAARVRAEVEYRWMRGLVVSKDIRTITESARVLVNYESVARHVRAIPGHAPVEIVPYAAETAFEEPLVTRPPPEPLSRLVPADAPVVVAVSRHDSRKGLDLLIEALGLLRQRRVAFRACLVGPGPLLEAHRRLTRMRRIDESTALVGFAVDPLAYLQHADVFCLPSTQEGSGSLSLLEAMQAANAIVASDVDGIPEDVTDGDSALLAEAGDIEALADALQRVLEDEGLRRRIGDRAREVYQSRFSAEVFSRSVGDVYRGLLLEASQCG